MLQYENTLGTAVWLCDSMKQLAFKSSGFARRKGLTDLHFGGDPDQDFLLFRAADKSPRRGHFWFICYLLCSANIHCLKKTSHFIFIITSENIDWF